MTLALSSGLAAGLFSRSAGAAITSTNTTNDATTLTYAYQYSAAGGWYRAYIDSARNAATGFAAAGIGANFMLENGSLFRHVGPQYSSTWTQFQVFIDTDRRTTIFPTPGIPSPRTSACWANWRAERASRVAAPPPGTSDGGERRSKIGAARRKESFRTALFKAELPCSRPTKPAQPAFGVRLRCSGRGPI